MHGTIGMGPHGWRRTGRDGPQCPPTPPPPTPDPTPKTTKKNPTLWMTRTVDLPIPNGIIETNATLKTLLEKRGTSSRLRPTRSAAMLIASLSTGRFEKAVAGGAARGAPGRI